jgi:hypothetical protein
LTKSDECYKLYFKNAGGLVMTVAVRAHQIAPLTVPFVCSVIGGDADEALDHIMVRKEAERSAGTADHSGEFWWGLSAPLGRDVEAMAKQNAGTLPILFSKSSNTSAAHSSQVRIWNKWRSILDPQQHGRIPDHVIVTSGHNPNPNKKRSASHSALICYSGVKLTLGNLGYCDLAQCRTAKNGKSIDYLVGARLLVKQQPLTTPLGTPSLSVRRVAFQARLIRHCYVKLEGADVLTQAELNSLRQYKPGDDWSALVKQLRH